MSLFKELRRRNVIRVAAAYAVATWLLLQIVDVLVPMLTLPEWVGRFVLLLLAIGFPIALIFAWAFELTPDGIKKEADVDRTQSVVSQTGRKLNQIIIATLSVAVIWFAWDKFSGPSVETIATEDVTVAAAPAAPEKSVAVLPFVAMSSGEDDEYFADGLTEEILNSLAQLPELLVTARTSAFSFKGQDLPVQEIAAALGVDHIVEGSVRRSGDRLRVTAQLIRASDGFHLWSDNYDSTSTDAIAVQENIAEQIAVAMDVVMDDERRETMRNVGLRDVQAFIDYQKGIDWFNRAHGEMDQKEGLRLANLQFDKVIERVPEFALTYNYRSDRYVHLVNEAGFQSYPTDAMSAAARDWLDLAILDYGEAVRFSPNPETRTKMDVNLAFLGGNWNGMTGRIGAVLEEGGCTPDNWFPLLAITFGFAAEYYEYAKDIVACDPRRSLSWFDYSRAAYWNGDLPDALRLAQQGFDEAPGSWLNMHMVTLLISNGEFDAARDMIDSRFQFAPAAMAMRVRLEAAQGNVEVAQQMQDQFDAMDDMRIFTVSTRAWRGDREDANRIAAEMDQLDYAYISMFTAVVWCACGAPWDLEATPNFAARLAQGKLPWPPASPAMLPLKDW